MFRKRFLLAALFGQGERPRTTLEACFELKAGRQHVFRYSHPIDIEAADVPRAVAAGVSQRTVAAVRAQGRVGRSRSSARTRACERLGHDGAPELRGGKVLIQCLGWGLSSRIREETEKPRFAIRHREPAPWVASYRKRRAKKLLGEPRVRTTPATTTRSPRCRDADIVERNRGWTDDGYTKGGFIDAGYVSSLRALVTRRDF